MDNQKIARELLKVAKGLIVAKPKPRMGEQVKYFYKPTNRYEYGQILDIDKDSVEVDNEFSINKRELVNIGISLWLVPKNVFIVQ